MVYTWCLLTCFLGLTLGFAIDQETTSIKPLILDDPPMVTLDLEGDPPAVSPSRETTTAVPVLRKEDIGGFENVNPSHVNGEELFEADILLSSEQRRQLLERKAIPITSMRWPNGPKGTPVVPYKFGSTAVNRTAVEAGLAHWELHTCIDFQLISGTTPSKYLNFIKDTGCWSYVGMQSTPQNLSIGDGCTGLGTVAHEVGHAMGFYHEQSRSDRDNYVSIISGNIQPGAVGNFQKQVDNNYSVKYDFTSDLHYGSDYFSVNGKNTIATKNPLAQELIGKRTGLSHYDKLLANTMYPCIRKWMQNCSISTNPCQNDGYIGKKCACVCRSGTSGANCQIVNQSYYDSLISSCSAIVTAPGKITSPNYPSNYPAGARCVKWIQGPKCTIVKIKFNSFRLYGKNPYCGGNICCYFDALEIRTTNLTVGDVYCDQDIAAGKEFKSSSNQMILFFRTESSFYPGWSANVTFEPVPSCLPSTNTTTGGKCKKVQLSPISMQWTSPNFGLGNYPNNESCSLPLSSTSPAWLELQLNRFSLDSTDQVTFLRPTTTTLTLKNSQSGVMKLPSMNTVASFFNSATGNGVGFNITINSKTTSCHRLITTGGAGANGTIAAPALPNNAWQRKACEFWIRSPTGTKIRLTFTMMTMNTTCSANSVIVNKAGNVAYPTATSQTFCGTALPAPITSTANAMNVLFFSTTDNKVFEAKWSVVV